MLLRLSEYMFYAAVKCQIHVTLHCYIGSLQVYAKNGEWEITSQKLFRVEFRYEGYEDVFYPELHFVLYFQRKSLYYIMNIVLPSCMLSILVLTVFKLPPESGEKMSMGVTLLLSYSVFLLMVSDNVPNTSQAVPLIGQKRYDY